MHYDVIANYGERIDLTIRANAAVLADHHGRLNLRGSVNFCAFANPDSFTNLRQFVFGFYLALEHIDVGLPIHGQVSDIAPVSVSDVAVQGLVAQK